MPSMDAFFTKTLKKTNILSTARGVIHNKFVLYFIFFAALFQLLFSVVQQDYLYCVLFLLVGFLVHFFNKNMTVILTLAMAISTVLSNIIKGGKLHVEGLETKTSAEKDDSIMEESVEQMLEQSQLGDNVVSVKKPAATANATTAANATAANATTANATTSATSNTAKATSMPKKPSATAPVTTTSPSQMMEVLKDQALDLQEAQKHIINGFEQIAPHMDRAETLIGSIQQTAQTIQGMRNMHNV